MRKSLLNKASLLFLFLVPGAFMPTESMQQKCNGVELKIEVTNASSALQKGSVEAIVSGAEKPIYYIFYKPSGQLISTDVTISKIENVDPGTYYCSVVDGKGCTKKTEFKIE